MGIIGEYIKTQDEHLRDLLGTEYLLNGVTGAGRADFSPMTTKSVSEQLGTDNEQEFNLAWAGIKLNASVEVNPQDSITVNGSGWIVRRVHTPTADGVITCKDCLCIEDFSE